MKKNIIYILLLVLLILVDQIIKNEIIIRGNSVIIENVINLTYTENTGGAFSVGAGHIDILVFVNILVIGIVIGLAYMNKKWNLSIFFILAGGLSNLFDRITRGFVVDYIDITNIINFPIFNLADICIVIGAIVFAIQIIYYKGTR